MSTKINHLLLLIIISLLVISNSACTKEKPELQSGQQLASAANSTPGAAGDSKVSSNVYGIESVSKVVAGKATDFTWKADGKIYTFSEFTKGKVVFLNFWGTWCPPCRREIPDIVEISKDLANKDFVVIGIACERPGSDLATNISNVKSFADAKGIPYQLFTTASDNRALSEAYGGIQAVPTTFIIDKQGKINETLVGMRSKDEFMQSINRVLK
ncbi:MAG: TlpA disulfide reductase family protein [FCB group bacterium]|jgi:cytochrome c biogenesis protein CcmG/thiol:disulfide interchange protein DsbE